MSGLRPVHIIPTRPTPIRQLTTSPVAHKHRVLNWLMKRFNLHRFNPKHLLNLHPALLAAARAAFPSRFPKYNLSPHQQVCIDACMDARSRGVNSMLISSPTGSGKTLLIADLIYRLPPIEHCDGSLGRRVLVLVQRTQLKSQLMADINQLLPQLSIGVEQGPDRSSPQDDVVVAMVQSLSRGGLERLSRLNPTDFKAVIVDEAHHSTSPSYLKILRHFDSHVSAPESTGETRKRKQFKVPAESTVSVPPKSDLPPTALQLQLVPTAPARDAAARPRVPVYGLTATPERTDGTSLGHVFEEVACNVEWLDMVEKKWLSEPRFFTIDAETPTDLEGVPSLGGDFNLERLNERVNNFEDIEKIVARDRKATVVYGVSVSHAEQLCDEFIRQGVDARVIHSKLSTVEQRQILDLFAGGEFPVLVNCMVLLEGINIPRIDCIITRQTRSPSFWRQMTGRGARLSPETRKTDCYIFEQGGSEHVNATTLFGVEPNRVLTGQTPRDLGCSIFKRRVYEFKWFEHAEDPTRPYYSALVNEGRGGLLLIHVQPAPEQLDNPELRSYFLSCTINKRYAYPQIKLAQCSNYSLEEAQGLAEQLMWSKSKRSWKSIVAQLEREATDYQSIV
ncbi:P-loop containing nucleoside triphosphate hydrolase protein [Pseudohyphozyma bogoriensis]|nr:P-loop containing nucleoside triphosphate hydrolase protein [Pseudohyphozyma bogoriensis]